MNELVENEVLLEIKEELETFVGKKTYRCPLCEKLFEWDDVNYNPAEQTYTCPKCLVEHDEHKLLEVNAYELIEEMFMAYKEKNKKEIIRS